MLRGIGRPHDRAVADEALLGVDGGAEGGGAALVRRVAGGERAGARLHVHGEGGGQGVRVVVVVVVQVVVVAVTVVVEVEEVEARAAGGGVLCSCVCGAAAQERGRGGGRCPPRRLAAHWEASRRHCGLRLVEETRRNVRGGERRWRQGGEGRSGGAAGAA